MVAHIEREGRELRALDSWVLMTARWQGIGDKYIMRRFIIYTIRHIILRLNKRGLFGLVGHVIGVPRNFVRGFNKFS